MTFDNLNFDCLKVPGTQTFIETQLPGVAAAWDYVNLRWIVAWRESDPAPQTDGYLLSYMTMLYNDTSPVIGSFGHYSYQLPAIRCRTGGTTGRCNLVFGSTQNEPNLITAMGYFNSSGYWVSSGPDLWSSGRNAWSPPALVYDEYQFKWVMAIAGDQSHTVSSYRALFTYIRSTAAGVAYTYKYALGTVKSLSAPSLGSKVVNDFVKVSYLNLFFLEYEN